MAALEIIGAPRRNFVRAVRIARTEKGVPYTLNPARPHTAEIDAIHPYGKIPVMRRGDLTPCEDQGHLQLYRSGLRLGIRPPVPSGVFLLGPAGRRPRWRHDRCGTATNARDVRAAQQ